MTLIYDDRVPILRAKFSDKIARNHAVDRGKHMIVTLQIGAIRQYFPKGVVAEHLVIGAPGLHQYLSTMCNKKKTRPSSISVTGRTIIKGGYHGFPSAR